MDDDAPATRAGAFTERLFEKKNKRWDDSRSACRAPHAPARDATQGDYLGVTRFEGGGEPCGRHGAGHGDGGPCRSFARGRTQVKDMQGQGRDRGARRPTAEAEISARERIVKMPNTKIVDELAKIPRLEGESKTEWMVRAFHSWCDDAAAMRQPYSSAAWT